MSPRLVLTDAKENAALRAKVARAIARDRHERFWLSVQSAKQPARLSLSPLVAGPRL